MELHLALLHFDVHYKQPAKNKAGLLKYMQQAAEDGANIIVTPEMSVSGYSFSSRADIADYVEDAAGAFIGQAAELAEHFGCYICMGLALRQPTTDCFTNSAVVVGPAGFSFRYDKINGEIRWAKPGNPQQQCCFDTPWGRIGILICSDTYYELQSRIVALQGAELVLVPAAWPSSGLDPVEIWQVRALENGFAIAVCNRTGQDMNMSCEDGESCVINEYGEILFRGNNGASTIFSAALPLVVGRLNNKQKAMRLQERTVDKYHSCYRSMNVVQDTTSLLGLPEPGTLSISCLVARGSFQAERVEQLRKQLMNPPAEREVSARFWLVTVPDTQPDNQAVQPFMRLAQEFHCWIFVQQDKHCYLIDHAGQLHDIKDLPATGDSVYPQRDIGPAQAVFMPFQALFHPENTVAASKQGCDLVVIYSQHFDEEVSLLCGARTISNLCTVLTAANGAGIWMRPEGHGRWAETICKENGICTFILDTHLTREKRFQDRVDFDRLLLP